MTPRGLRREVLTVPAELRGQPALDFLNPRTGLRIDLLFDYPLPASTLNRHATTVKARSTLLRLASEADLLRLKKLAREQRSSPGDAEDIAFLEARRAQKP